MDRILGPPLPHVARKAVRFPCFRARRSVSRFRFLLGVGRGMAPQAHFNIMTGRFSTRQLLVWVVTGDTGYSALQKASGLPEPISLLRNLHPVVVPCASLAIEREPIVSQWFAWSIGEWGSSNL